jgi:uncharacterized oligopeptide transporter (OPT) family protein
LLQNFDFSKGDPLPEDPILKARETRQCTLRSIIVGSIFGLIIGAANIYVGLRIGWGLGAGTFSIFCGYGVLKFMQERLPVGWGGGYFGPKENVSVQSAANGASSGSSLFVAAYLLNDGLTDKQRSGDVRPQAPCPHA